MSKIETKNKINFEIQKRRLSMRGEESRGRLVEEEAAGRRKEGGRGWRISS